MAKILVIDDEPGVVRFVSRALEGAGHSVDHAYDGSSGLRRSLELEPDLVILDLVMNGLSGMGVLSALLTERPASRVMVVSAESDVESRVRCLEAGAVDYLTKPFALREFLARINHRLRDPRAREEARPDALRVGDLRLDRRTHVLHCGDAGVELSRREFVLVQHLMEHAGDVCTRAELLAEVWGYAHDPGSNVIDVAVARLRTKIRGLRIETVRNVGYALRQA